MWPLWPAESKDLWNHSAAAALWNAGEHQQYEFVKTQFPFRRDGGRRAEWSVRELVLFSFYSTLHSSHSFSWNSWGVCFVACWGLFTFPHVSSDGNIFSRFTWILLIFMRYFLLFVQRCITTYMTVYLNTWFGNCKYSSNSIPSLLRWS